MDEYEGVRLTIRYCEDAPAGQPPESWTEALGHLPAGKHDSVTATMAARRRFLADRGQLRFPDHWNTEGRLPDGKRFYAIKVGKLRAYGWFSRRFKGVFYISHFAFKQGQRLSAADASRVTANWRHIEEAGS